MLKQAAIAISLYCGFASPDLRASEVLDQFNDAWAPSPNSWANTEILFNLTSSQIVNVGITGKLSRVVLPIYRETDIMTALLYVDIARMDGEFPDFSETGRYATRSLSPSEVLYENDSPYMPPFGHTSIDFSAFSLHFNAEDQFAIILRSNTGKNDEYAWQVNWYHDTYPTIGYQYNPISGERYDGGPNLDHEFQTFVIPDSPIEGDFTGDGNVDTDDLAEFMTGFGTTFDGSDFLNWQRNFDAIGTSFPIPEPPAAMLAVSTLVGISRLCRRNS